MDIKQIRPNASQNNQTVADKNSGSLTLPPFTTQFAIRTMNGDLNKENKIITSTVTAPISSATATSLNAAPPTIKEFEPKIDRIDIAPVQQTAKEIIMEAAKQIEAEQKIIPAAQTPKTSFLETDLTQSLEQASLKLAARDFKSAIAAAQKIIDSENIGWFAKWQAKKIISKAQEGLNQEKIISTPPTPKPTIATAPTNLPTIEGAPAASPTPSSLPEGPKLSIAPPKMPPALETKMIGAKNVGSEVKTEFDIKKIALTGFLSILILSLIGGGIWFFWPKSTPQPTPSPRPSAPQATASVSASPLPTPEQPALFRTDNQKTFTLKTDQAQTDFQRIVAQLLSVSEPAGSFSQVLIKNDQGNKLSLDELLSAAEIDIFDLPTQTSTLKQQLDMDRFSFYVYAQEPDNSSPFTAQNNLGRLGLVITIAATSTDQLTKSLKDLEQLMPTGLKSLIPTAKNNTPTKSNFLADQYSGVDFRYTQMPDSTLGLAYAIVGNKLLIATSKNSFRSAIDRLLEQ